ncbi:flavodoxin [Jiulongibacter sp. NS-SX5]|uniref:flavodoxin n=1 Tax=Jiulongibacter sp. NS-SX5 TaxID=3463854 RepID=UPI004058461A
MKYLSLFLLSILCLSQCRAQTSHDNSDEKILTIYLSRTGNTEALAQTIHSKVGGEIMALKLKDPYPDEYQTIVAQVADENASGFLPPLANSISNIDEYTTMFIGFPTWGMQLPPPFKSFIHDYDLSKKRVIPFNTNAGYGLGNSIETLKNGCSSCKMEEPFSVKGGIERDGVLFVMQGQKLREVEKELVKWLDKLGF